MKKNGTKSVLVMLATAILMLCLMLSTSAEEVLPEAGLIDTARVQTELYGDVNTPYFSVENSTQNALAFCVESNKSHPEAGSMYMSSVYEKSEEIKNNLVVWNVLINASMEEQTDMLYKVTQQALWDAIDGGNSHRAITLRRLGPDAVELYDKLFDEASWSYKVDFQFWATATDAEDVQVLMTYEVVELAEPTIETVYNDKVEYVYEDRITYETVYNDKIEYVYEDNIIYETVYNDVIVPVYEDRITYETIYNDKVEYVYEDRITYETVYNDKTEYIYEDRITYETVYNDVIVPEYVDRITYETVYNDKIEYVYEDNIIYETVYNDVIVPVYEDRITYETVYNDKVEYVYEDRITYETVYNDIVVEIEEETSNEDEVLGDEYVPEYNPEPIPQTGDTTNFVLAGIVGIIALCAFLFTIKKKEQE